MSTPARNRVYELELELIQSHMTQRRVLRGEVDARALRVQVRSQETGFRRKSKYHKDECLSANFPKKTFPAAYFVRGAWFLLHSELGNLLSFLIEF